jgi:hypothetical protein
VSEDIQDVRRRSFVGEIELTDLRRLAASQLGEELRVLMRLVSSPSIVGAEGVKKGILYIFQNGVNLLFERGQGSLGPSHDGVFKIGEKRKERDVVVW